MTVDDVREILAPFGADWFGFSQTPPHHKVMHKGSGVLFDGNMAWATDRRTCARIAYAHPASDDPGDWIAKMRSLPHWAMFDSHKDWQLLGLRFEMDLSYEPCPKGCASGMIFSEGACNACDDTGNAFCGHLHINGRILRLPVIRLIHKMVNGVEYAHIDNATLEDPLLIRGTTLEGFVFQAVLLGTKALPQEAA